MGYINYLHSSPRYHFPTCTNLSSPPPQNTVNFTQSNIFSLKWWCQYNTYTFLADGNSFCNKHFRLAHDDDCHRKWSHSTQDTWQNHKHLIQECQLSDIMIKGKEKNNHFHFGDNHTVSGSIMTTDSEGQWVFILGIETLFGASLCWEKLKVIKYLGHQA